MSDLARAVELRSQGRRQREAAGVLCLSRSRVANLQRIADKAPKLWMQWVDQGKVTLKHVEAVLSLASTEGERLLRATMAGGWSARRLRDEVRAAKGGRREADPHPDADVARLELTLSELLATRVAIRTKPDGQGELVLGFTDADTLEGLLERLGYRAE